MYFSTEVEDEFIMDALLNRLDRPIFNQSKKIYIDFLKIQTQTQTFQIGGSLRYTN